MCNNIIKNVVNYDQKNWCIYASSDAKEDRVKLNVVFW